LAVIRLQVVIIIQPDGCVQVRPVNLLLFAVFCEPLGCIA
jgi:hypothetical protein